MCYKLCCFLFIILCCVILSHKYNSFAADQLLTEANKSKKKKVEK